MGLESDFFSCCHHDNGEKQNFLRTGPIVNYPALTPAPNRRCGEAFGFRLLRELWRPGAILHSLHRRTSGDLRPSFVQNIDSRVDISVVNHPSHYKFCWKGRSDQLCAHKSRTTRPYIRASNGTFPIPLQKSLWQACGS